MYVYVCIFLYMHTLTRLSKEIGNYLIRNSSKMGLIYYGLKNERMKEWMIWISEMDTKKIFFEKTPWAVAAVLVFTIIHHHISILIFM